MKEKVQILLNEQITHEFFSAYLYLSMAAYFESNNLKGFSNWMKKQAEEEKGHAMKFFNFIFERKGNVKLDKIEAPKQNWKSSLEAFEDAYAHEVKVTQLINRIYETANEEKDYATMSFLKWFIDEQVEEEASALEIVEKLRLIGENKMGLLMMDNELSKRS